MTTEARSTELDDEPRCCLCGSVVDVRYVAPGEVICRRCGGRT